MSLMLGANIWAGARGGGMATAPSAWETLLDSLASETNGAIWDFTDPDYPRELIRDTTTPANSVDRDANTGLTYTSPNAKNVTGADGLLKYENHNKCLQSQDLSTTWSPSNATITTNTAVAPDGTTTADKITATAAGGDCIVAQNVSGRLASAYVKYVNAPWVAFSNNSHFCWFNVQTGVAGTISPGGGSSTIVDAGNGWWKLTWIQDSSAIGILRLRVGSADFTASVAGGEEALYWGIQVKDYPVHDDGTLSDYVPTTTAAKYRLPIDHDSAGDPLGLLVEEARTNLCLRSEEFSNASWVKSNTTATADQTTAPDGTSTADLITTTSTNNCVIYQAVTLASAAANTWSVYVKKGTAGFLVVNAYDSTNRRTYFNLTTGAVATNAAGNTATIVDIGGGWFRCAVTRTTDTTACFIQLELTDADNNTAVTSGVTAYLWGAQLEAGSKPSSYIRTVAATVTRAADQDGKATSGFPWSATNGMLVVKARPYLANSLGGIVSVNDGTGNEEIVLYRDASGNLVYQVEDGGADQLAPLDSAANAADGTVFTMAAAYKANDFAVSVGGAAVVADTGGTLPTVTTLEFGANQANNYFNGHIQWIKYVPRDVSDANLVSESAP